MKLNIRERRLKIAAEIRKNTTAGIEALSNLLEISKSSVHRHKKALKKAISPPRCEVLETTLAQTRLRLQTIAQDQEIYHKALHTSTQSVHPFNLNTNESQ